MMSWQPRIVLAVLARFRRVSGVVVDALLDWLWVYDIRLRERRRT